jgi:ribosomal protein S18 acetylase RimI-like enzyme
MGYSVNALLGAKHPAFVYRATAQMPDALVRVAVDGDTILGAVSATLDEDAAAHALRRQMSFVQRCTTALRLGITPACWSALLAARRASKPVVVGGTPIQACLTSIIVDPHCQGCGIGRGLVAAVDEFMQQRGQTHYRLDTRASNTGARAFYTRLGFREHSQRDCDIIFVKTL